MMCELCDCELGDGWCSKCAAEADKAAAVRAERERCAMIVDRRVDVIVRENGFWESDTNVTNLPEWAETACEELEAIAAAIRAQVAK